MSNAGDISVSLVLDGANAFQTQLRASAAILDKVSGSADKLDKAQEAGAKSTETWTHKIRDFAIILGLARSALDTVSSIAFTLPRAILEQNSMLERNTALIEGMSIASMGLAEAQRHAKEEVVDLLKISSSSPYAIQSVLDSYTKLRVGGVEKTKDSLEALINTASKFGSTSEQLKRGSIAIQQMLGKGVISMEELRQQLGEAIPDIMGIMSRALNTDMSTMVKKVSTGTVESGNAVALMFKEMAWSSMGSAHRMAETWDGLMNQLKNQMTIISKQIGDAGFFEEMKSIVKELKDMLADGEISGSLRDISDILSAAARGGFELGKALAENLKIILAIGAAMTAASLVRKGAGMASSVLGGAANQLGEYKASLAQMERIRAQHYERINSLDSRAWDSVMQKARQNSSMTMAQMTSMYETTKNRMFDQSIETIRRMDEMERKAKSLTSRAAMAAGSVVNALGGWTNIVMIGITALIYALDELVWKQERAAKNILDSNGATTNVQEYKDAGTKLERMEAEIERKRAEVKKLEEAEPLKPQQLGQAYGHTIDLLARSKRELEAMVKETDKLRVAMDRAQGSIKTHSAELGSDRALSNVSTKLRELSAEYEKGMKDIQKKSMPTEQSMVAQEELRLSILRKYQTVSLNEAKYWSDQIRDLNTKNAGKDFKLWSIDDQHKISLASGALSGLNENFNKMKASVDAGKMEFITRNSTDQLTKYQNKFNEMTVAVERLKESNEALKSGEKSAAEEVTTRLRLESGYYGKIDQAQRDKLLNLAKEHDAQKALNSEIKRSQQLHEQAEVRLGNNITQLAKKLGTASAKSLNPFLGWRESSLQTEEVIKQITAQLKEAGKLTSANISGLSKLDSLQEEVDVNNIKFALAKENQRLSEEFLTSKQKETLEYQKQVVYLKELRDSLSAISDPKERQAIEDMISSIEARATSNHAQKNPFAVWLRSAQDLNEQVGQQLVNTMDGLFDGLIDKMIDTDASFSEIMTSMTKSLQKFLIKMVMMNAMQGMFGGMFGGGAAAGASSKASYASNDSLNSMLDTSLFADGGIMSSMGSVPLRKYAKGGIATSPQVAVFGEGAHNEAYVPLPDGRTIPVTMQGSSSPTTVVNVINQTGTSVEAEQSNPRFDGDKYIIDVVMKAASRPGKFRTMMQGNK